MQRPVAYLELANTSRFLRNTSTGLKGGWA